MRRKGTAPSLHELIGDMEGEEKGEKEGKNEFGLHDLHEILGDKMPEIPFNRVGRYRLQNALQQRFGPGFHNIPGVKNVMKEFDVHMRTHNVIKANRET